MTRFSEAWYSRRIAATESRPSGSVDRKAAAGHLPPGESPRDRPSKYGNVKTNGYASKREADHAAYLQVMERSGTIRNLREQVKYLLIPKQEGERECSYIADFVYENRAIKGDWETVVVDCKGFRTPDYIIKRKLMLFVHHIRVKEV